MYESSSGRFVRMISRKSCTGQVGGGLPQVLVLRWARALPPIVKPGFPLFQSVRRTLRSFNTWGSSYVHRSCSAWDFSSLRNWDELVRLFYRASQKILNRIFWGLATLVPKSVQSAQDCSECPKMSTSVQSAQKCQNWPKSAKSCQT